MAHQSTTPAPSFRFKDLGLIGIYLFAFAACGWAVLIGNMFGFAGKAGWIIPKVEDVSGLIASILLLLVLSLAPYSLKLIFKRSK